MICYNKCRDNRGGKHRMIGGKDMKTTEITFEAGNATFTRTTNGYYYMKSAETEDRWKRIKQAEFEAVYNDYMEETTVEEGRAAEAIEGSSPLTEEVYEEPKPTEKSTEPAKAKGKKKRRSKAVFTYTDLTNGDQITLTEKQVDFFKHLPDTCFWEDGLNSSPWIDVLCDEIGGQFAGKPMTVGAMISTLKEKGLLIVSKKTNGVNGGRARYFELTEIGKMVARELGLAD